MHGRRDRFVALGLAVDIIARAVPVTVLLAVLAASAGASFWSSRIGAEVYVTAWQALHAVGLAS